MFGRGASALFDRLPDLPELESGEARRLLSTAYLDITSAKADAERITGPDAAMTRDYLRRLANAVESHGVFDEHVSADVCSACAFIAAESLALLADLLPFEEAVAELTCSSVPWRRAPCYSGGYSPDMAPQPFNPLIAPVPRPHRLVWGALGQSAFALCPRQPLPLCNVFWDTQSIRFDVA